LPPFASLAHGLITFLRRPRLNNLADVCWQAVKRFGFLIHPVVPIVNAFDPGDGMAENAFGDVSLHPVSAVSTNGTDLRL